MSSSSLFNGGEKTDLSFFILEHVISGQSFCILTDFDGPFQVAFFVFVAISNVAFRRLAAVPMFFIHKNKL